MQSCDHGLEKRPSCDYAKRHCEYAVKNLVQMKKLVDNKCLIWYTSQGLATNLWQPASLWGRNETI